MEMVIKEVIRKKVFTLAICLTHASRTLVFGVRKRRGRSGVEELVDSSGS